MSNETQTPNRLNERNAILNIIIIFRFSTVFRLFCPIVFNSYVYVCIYAYTFKHISLYICFQKREKPNQKLRWLIISFFFFLLFCFVSLSEGSWYSIFGSMMQFVCLQCTEMRENMVQRSIWWVWTLNIPVATQRILWCEQPCENSVLDFSIIFGWKTFYVSGAKQYIDFSLNPDWPWYRVYDGHICILFINFEFHASITFTKVLAKEFQYTEKRARLNDNNNNNNYKNRLPGTSYFIR